MASNYLNNIQDVGDKFNYLSSSNVYILDNSVYNKHDFGFYISGEMAESNSGLSIGDDLLLNITLNNSGTISETSAECDIEGITGNNYTLNCQPNSNINEDNLQVALSQIDDSNILLVNFAQQNQEEDDGSQNSIKYVKKSSGGLSAGAIVAIVLVPIVVLAAIAGTIIFLKKRSSPSINNSESKVNL